VEVGTADDSTAEVDGATDELEGATDDCETAELAVIGLEDGTTDADEDEDSNVGLAGAEELSGAVVAVSEGTTEDGDGITEEATNDDDGVEVSKEEAISEENDSAIDDGAADLELAIDLHRLVTSPHSTHEVVETDEDENEIESGEGEELVNFSLMGVGVVMNKGFVQSLGLRSMKWDLRRS
jgi:hypothetical protein